MASVWRCLVQQEVKLPAPVSAAVSFGAHHAVVCCLDGTALATSCSGGRETVLWRCNPSGAPIFCPAAAIGEGGGVGLSSRFVVVDARGSGALVSQTGLGPGAAAISLSGTAVPPSGPATPPGVEPAGSGVFTPACRLPDGGVLVGTARGDVYELVCITPDTGCSAGGDPEVRRRRAPGPAAEPASRPGLQSRPALHLGCQVTGMAVVASAAGDEGWSVVLCTALGHCAVATRSSSPRGAGHDLAWRLGTAVKLPAPCFSTPMTSGGYIVMGCRDDAVHALRLT